MQLKSIYLQRKPYLSDDKLLIIQKNNRSTRGAFFLSEWRHEINKELPLS